MQIRLLIVLLCAGITTFAQDRTLEKKLDDYLKTFVEGKDFAGNILIAKKGKIVFHKSHGLANIDFNIPNNPKTVFLLASVTKPFTAILTMKLYEQGRINLTDKVSKFISNFPNGDKITIHHLLSQTSGLPDYNRFPDYDAFSLQKHSLQQTVDWFTSRPLAFEPGSRYGYANSNFVTLALIIEKITGLSYDEFLKQQITSPLQMNQTANYQFEDIVPNRATGYDIGAGTYGLNVASYFDKSFKKGSGSLHSTTEDLLKLDQALYDTLLLKEKTKQLMFTSIDSNNYGYGWITAKRFGKYEFVEHDGKSPGFSALFSRYPNEQVTIIFLSNINSGLFGQIRNDLAAIVFGEPYKQPSLRKYVQLSPSELQAFAGKYAFPSGFKFIIRIENGNAYVYFGESKDGALLTPLSNKELFLRSRFDKLSLQNTSEGIVIAYEERTGVSICKKIE